MADHGTDDTFEPRVPAPDGSADRVREGVLEEASRIAGQTWQDEEGNEHPYVEPTQPLAPAEDLTPEDLGMEPPAPTSIETGRAKRGRGRKQAPNPDTHVEMPADRQEERAEQAIMELGVYQGRRVDRREVKFSGSAGLSAYHPEGVELWHAMKGASRVIMTVIGTIGNHGVHFTTDKEGDVIEVIAQRTLKIDVIQLRALASDTEGLPMFDAAPDKP